MATEIKVPSLGESVTEATVAKWFKTPGEAVIADEPLVELETDKITMEVPAPVTGVLSEIVVTAGSNVAVGAVLGRITEGAVATVAPAATPVSAPPPPSPAVRRMVEEQRLDAASIPATGKDGRLTKEDIVNVREGRTPQAAPLVPTLLTGTPTPPPSPVSRPRPAAVGGLREERVPMTRLRKRIAERLKEAQNTAAMLTTFNEVDMTEILALRNRFKDAFERKHGVKLGFMSFFVKACVGALKELPAVNAEIDGGDIVYKHHYDIGVAVGTSQGLVVPVVRDADTMSFAEIEAAIGTLGAKARDGKLALDELTGGTFTITNGGVYGSLMSTPILNPPQSGILGMHKTQQRPMVMPDGSIQARPMMYVALSYDHRIIDGREAVTFLVRVKESLEDPARLLFEV
ncbi:MAG: 2-oxoglutarate dehydrogenase complex dihydrolipoyllysine-residue succinyltransferase [Alphaproteobacteria bacterium]